MGRVLLVDDEPGILGAVERDLCGVCDCLKAESGEQALKVLKKNDDVEAALVDIMMPGMSGVDLLAAIKRDYRHVGVIMLTAYGPGAGIWDNLFKCRRAGAFGFLEKPYKKDALTEGVLQCLDVVPRFWRAVTFETTYNGEPDPAKPVAEIGGSTLSRLRSELAILASGAASLRLIVKCTTFLTEPDIAFVMKLAAQTKLVLQGASADLLREIEMLCKERVSLVRKGQDVILLGTGERP